MDVRVAERFRIEQRRIETGREELETE